MWAWRWSTRNRPRPDRARNRSSGPSPCSAVFSDGGRVAGAGRCGPGHRACTPARRIASCAPWYRGRLLEQDALTERYRLGLGAAVLGQRAARHFGLERAEAELHDLAAASGEAASLGGAGGQRGRRADTGGVAAAIALRPAAGIAGRSARVGHGQGAAGLRPRRDRGTGVKALGPLGRYTPRTITSGRRLVADLDSVTRARAGR